MVLASYVNETYARYVDETKASYVNETYAQYINTYRVYGKQSLATSLGFTMRAHVSQYPHACVEF